MLHDITFALWFLLPAACANVAPILTAPLPVIKKWSTPIDGGRTFRGKELLGSHKTWRGLVSGMVAATMILWLEQLAVAHFDWAQTLVGDVHYAALPTLILGPLFAIGALGGDALESFFKRQRGIKSGGSWVPFDQLDYIVGSVIVSLPFVILAPLNYVWILVVWFVIHLAASYTGWLVGLKKDPI